ncbi:MAG: hypothetical protein KatS3mg033_0423 [Thermonema sp.]|uniref:hypothetical protein n=1 Tax=Thermonema sp. TaxID=2231181 RepID=UPI0021DB89C4|nr:hypothetical protein [Thermonema sp.]GIV38623.1 MAG: hypothetical protein KatS3mg033_0423 [Thermonema sp.]
MIRIKLWLLLCAGLCGLTACDIQDNRIEPGERFSRIYDTGEYERAYYAVDVAPTADSGFIVLGAAEVDFSDFYGLYLLKIDKEGFPEWQYLASSDYVHPLGFLSDGANNLQVVCMDATGLYPLVLTVAPEPALVAAYPSVEYPLAFSRLNDGRLAFLAYDRVGRNSVVAFSDDTRQTFPIYEDVEALIFQHISRRGQQFPFFIGQTPSGQIFFNGFNNYTLALTFLDAGSSQTGVVNGTRYEAGMSACVALPQSNRFSIARFSEDGRTYFAPSVSIDPNGVSSSSNLKGYLIQELSPKAGVRLLHTEAGGLAVILYLSSTQNGQIALYAYDAEGGQLLGTRYFGHGNRFEAGAMCRTPDGGLLITGRVWMAGRFARLCVFKLNEEDIRQLLQP